MQRQEHMNALRNYHEISSQTPIEETPTKENKYDDDNLPF